MKYKDIKKAREAMNNYVEVPESAYMPKSSKPAEYKGWWKSPVAELPSSSTDHTHSYLNEGLNPYSLGAKDGCPAYPPKQEGITPMRYETANVATASIAIPSDEAKKIDYLNDRATSIYRNFDSLFYTMFHIHGDKQPRYYKDLIDAIKNGEYEIDEKAAKTADEAWENSQDEDFDEGFYYSVFHGINFTKFPKPDYKGLEKARKELRDELTRIKDIIAIMPAEEALKAVQDFQNWKPSNAPAVQ
jgi:hypothetical protein